MTHRVRSDACLTRLLGRGLGAGRAATLGTWLSQVRTAIAKKDARASMSPGHVRPGEHMGRGTERVRTCHLPRPLLPLLSPNGVHCHTPVCASTSQRHCGTGTRRVRTPVGLLQPVYSLPSTLSSSQSDPPCCPACPALASMSHPMPRLEYATHLLGNFKSPAGRGPSACTRPLRPCWRPWCGAWRWLECFSLHG